MWKLTKNIWVTIILCLGALTALGGTIYAGVAVALNSAYAERQSADNGVTTWLVGNAGTDMLIAVALVTFLLRARKVASRFEASQLHAPLTRMIYLAIETGGFTTLWSIIALCVYKSNDESNASVGMGYCLGRWYSLTFLFCLFQRGQGVNGKSGSSHDYTHTHKSGLGQSRMTTGIQVRVDHNATTIVEGPGSEHELASFNGQPQAVMFGGEKVHPRQYMGGAFDEDEKVEYRRGGHEAV